MAVDIIVTELWKMMPFSTVDVSIMKEPPVYIIRVQWGRGFLRVFL
jgi:hypothetical protein